MQAGRAERSDDSSMPGQFHPDISDMGHQRSTGRGSFDSDRSGGFKRVIGPGNDYAELKNGDSEQFRGIRGTLTEFNSLREFGQRPPNSPKLLTVPIFHQIHHKST